MRKITIAIDGYSATGKSSTAREVAHRLGYSFIDSGAMYRAVTYYALEEGLDISNEQLIAEEAKKLKLRFAEDDQSSIYLNDQLLTTELREPRVNERVSDVAAITEVRREMVRQQQRMGTTGGIVMDGRDIGTMVFPNADLKVFLTASMDVRAERRDLELKEKGIHSDISSIMENLKERDRIDSTREEGPLRKASGALEIDTSRLTFEEQVDMIVSAAKRVINEN